ncbi:hypothetical protein [Buttiauxella brennerae]|uniref:hypothetical protein n=1 Tax=Buttiauxella brennerae TaxID=82988 RepID=UPI00286F07E2|nr:hypothetical protein [Buttiauxella brennerae]
MSDYSQFNDMLKNYESMAAKIVGDKAAEKAIEDPVKNQWAMQEGFRPVYNPNADKVTWVPQAQPHQAPNMARLQGSMSPEALSEVYPMFAHKKEQIDGVLTQIFQAAIDGGVTHQRAQELAMQLALDTYAEVSKGQKAKGAAAKAANFDQALDNASKKTRVAGVEE